MTKEEQNNVVYDDITSYGIMRTIKDEIYLIKDGKKMRLNALIIKERREEN